MVRRTLLLGPLLALAATLAPASTAAAPVPIPGDGGPKIDTYNVDGTKARPCARDEGPESLVTYTCRDAFESGRFIVYYYTWDAYMYVGPGDISGGNSSVYSKDGFLYEGCLYGGYSGGGAAGNYDICSVRSVDVRSAQYKQSGLAYYRMAFSRWGHDTAVAWSCLYAMYESDPYNIAHDCT